MTDTPQSNANTDNTANPICAQTPGIPFARPVAVEGPSEPIPFAAGGPPADTQETVWPPRMSRLRAIVELLVLIPAGGIVSVCAIASFSLMKLADKRWYNVIDGIGAGAGTLAACAIMLLIARHKPASIGWTRRDWLINALLGAAAMAITYVARFMILGPLSMLFPEILEQVKTAQQAIEQTFPPMNFAWIVLTMTFVVLWEEVVFRGFLLTRLQAICKRWWLTIPLASLVFGAIHGYQGVLAMALIASLALVLSLLFVWRRSLVPCMVLHWLNNVGVILFLRAISPTWR